ncbi:trypsin-like peptidase domain-containing protein [Streptomyces sp. NPDC001404]|uniref:trypsin-like peptidase domain-containing protein n=1 Tax=Streptomyces sp. NPDC001404 TaxID=3364571 RepID=UPI0036A57C05
MNGRRADAEDSLVRIRDLAGRVRGTGFLADDRGTLVTSHEVVDGLARLVLHAPGELTCVVGAEDVVALPECNLALVRTEGLAVPPLPIAAAEPVAGGAEVRLRTSRWQTARVVGHAEITYTATDRFHLLGSALELSLPGRAQLRLGEEATGGPVLDAKTGAVIAVLGTAHHSDRRAGGFAIPLRAAARTAAGGPLADLLERNAATVPAYGSELNLAGALHLTATSLGSVVTPRPWREPVERPDAEREFARFLDRGPDAPDAPEEHGGPGGPAGPVHVFGLVGDPGTGRTTELGALAARRARGAEPAPTLWLRGADLQVGDESVRDAVARALEAAGRIVSASAGAAGLVGGTAAPTPEAVAELGHRVGRPLLVLLDCPEEMPPVLAHGLAAWTEATAEWLAATETRMVVACRPEHWETAGALFPPGMLHTPEHGPEGDDPRALPPCSRIGGLNPGQAAAVRASYGIPPDAIDLADAGHPLALRLLAEVRAALPDGTAGGDGTGEAAPDRWEVFSGYLDLVCLRIAVRLAAARRPPLRGTAVRRLAARVAGQVHEAARRCLGPGQGELEREAFEELFPWRTGWASAVLTEGLLVPAGTGYRFAHEEFADWLQGAHLDLDAALYALVHRWYEPEGPPAEAPVRLPSRPGNGPAPAPAGHVPPPPGSSPRPTAARRRRRGDPPEPPKPLPVPRHRIGPVIQALLLLARRSGPTELSRRLTALVHAVETLAGGRRGGAGPDGQGRAVSDPSWWAAHLLGEALLRVPDATPYMGVLRLLAERITALSRAAGGFDNDRDRTLGGLAEFGPWFWLRLKLDLADRLDLLRLLVPADGPPRGSAQAAAARVLGGSTAARAEAAPRGLRGRAAVPGQARPAGPAEAAPAPSGERPEAPAVPRARTSKWERVGRIPTRAEAAAGATVPEVSPEPWTRSPERAGAGQRAAVGPDDGSVTAGRPGDGPGDPERSGDGRTAATAASQPSGGEGQEPVTSAVGHAGHGPAAPEPSGNDPQEPAASAATRTGSGPAAPAGRSGHEEPGHEHPDSGTVPPEAPGKRPAPQANRFLPAVATLLAHDPFAAQPLLCRWFTDDRPLQTAPGAGPRPTVATAAQALLHTHRRRAVDDLAEALVDAGHPKADELLAALAEDEPSALCRAVDRWAHDERLERHVAAAAYGLGTAHHVTTDADRELLRFSALALLARPAEGSLHGAALGLLVLDGGTRERYLPQAVARFAAGDPHLPPDVLAPALSTHPEPVLAAFRARLYEPGDGPAAVLRTLARVTDPTLARHAAALVREHVDHRPEGAANAAEFVDRRLEDGPSARAVLFPLVVSLLRTRPPQVRRALAPVLAAPGSAVSRPLRQELLEVLLEREEFGPYERDVTVLDALLRAVAKGAPERLESRTRDLVHRTGLLMSRTPEGAACFDRRVTQLAREVPVFGSQVRGWLKEAPALWAVVVGPSARIRLTADAQHVERERSGGEGEATDPADAGRREPAWHS